MGGRTSQHNISKRRKEVKGSEKKRERRGEWGRKGVVGQEGISTLNRFIREVRRLRGREG